MVHRRGFSNKLIEQHRVNTRRVSFYERSSFDIKP